MMLSLIHIYCVKTGAPAQKQDNYPVEFHALMTKALKEQDEGAENLAANQIKAQYIAQQILTRHETSDFRQWKDYVVLVRSHAVKSHLKQAFDQAGIPLSLIHISPLIRSLIVS